ncbi:hypothetical protein [Listeria aquatica]|uniref:hypothetical protein n=1 Tax=Listeria aquatica TaxID=1494960 RepID=UPI0031F59F5A
MERYLTGAKIVKQDRDTKAKLAGAFQWKDTLTGAIGHLKQEPMAVIHFQGSYG